VERLTVLQQAYISACEGQVMPPVTPDLTVLEALLRRRLEVNLDGHNRDSVKALTKFLEADECKQRLTAVRFVAGGEASAKPSRRLSRTAASEAALPAAEKGGALLRKLVVALGKLLAKAEALDSLALHGVRCPAPFCTFTQLRYIC
jgi:hypothetical protein